MLGVHDQVPDAVTVVVQIVLPAASLTVIVLPAIPVPVISGVVSLVEIGVVAEAGEPAVVVIAGAIGLLALIIVTLVSLLSLCNARYAGSRTVNPTLFLRILPTGSPLTLALILMTVVPTGIVAPLIESRLPPPYVSAGGVAPLLPMIRPVVNGLTRVPATYFWEPLRLSSMSTLGTGAEPLLTIVYVYSTTPFWSEVATLALLEILISAVNLVLATTLYGDASLAVAVLSRSEV